MISHYITIIYDNSVDVDDDDDDDDYYYYYDSWPHHYMYVHLFAVTILTW